MNEKNYEITTGRSVINIDIGRAKSRVPAAPGATSIARAVTVVACSIALLVTGGCSWWNKMTGKTETRSAENLPTSRPATTQLTYEVAEPVPPTLQANRPILQGPLPLIYLVEADGMLRVRNVETSEEIISFPVKAMQIVRVEAKGVMLANKPVIGANLAPGNYAIEIVNPDSNTIRSTQKHGVIKSQ